MPRIARLGDAIGHGGQTGNILSGSSDVYTNTIRTARVTDAVYCDLPGHGYNSIISGSTSVFVDGLAIARIGDSCACGAVILDGSQDANAGG